MADDTPREPFNPADHGHEGTIPPAPPFMSDPLLIGDMEKPDRDTGKLVLAGARRSGTAACAGSADRNTPRNRALALGLVAGDFARLALSAIVPQRFATWESAGLRDYLVSDPAFTKLAMLDTSLVIATRLRRLLEKKVSRFRAAATLLGLAVAATSLGTLAV